MLVKGGSRTFRNLSLIMILLVLLGSLGLSLYSLRQNNLRMKELRSSVFEADRQDKSRDEIDQALRSLRDYIIRHMNTNLQPSDSESNEPPIQLPYKYYRDTIHNWQRRIKNIDASKLTEFNLIRKTCESEDYVISERLSCVIEKTRNIDALPEPPILPRGYYVYNFVSPQWSPDVAGWSLVVFGLFLGLLVFRLLL